MFTVFAFLCTVSLCLSSECNVNRCYNQEQNTMKTHDTHTTNTERELSAEEMVDQQSQQQHGENREEEEKGDCAKQIVLWRYANPYLENPFKLTHRSFLINGYLVNIEQVVGAADERPLGTVVWDCGYVLAKYFERISHTLQHKRMLEVGSGTGITAIATALLGAAVVATDITDVLPHLKKNIEGNIVDKPIVHAPQVAELWWGDESSAILQERFDIVFAADVVYGDDISRHRNLLKTFVDAFEMTKATVGYIAYKPRFAGEKWFFKKIKHYFEVEVVPQEEVDEEFRNSPARIYRLLPKMQ